MLLEDLLWLVVSFFVVRAVWRVLDRMMDGASGRSRSPQAPPNDRDVPLQGVQMVRDPVCGTYIVPANSVTVTDGSRQVFFCSTTCRDKYRARTA